MLIKALLLAFLSSNFVHLANALKILNVWTPDVLENGTQLSALVDCEFTYDQEDLQSLELKWYFRHDPTPIYTWIPPNAPQVHKSFIDHINTNYEISSDPYKKHRALSLQGLSTKLSGRYSCRVSSHLDDDFRSKDLIIYSPARKTFLQIGWTSSTQLNITCEALQVYPEPKVKIILNSSPFLNESMDISDDASRSVVWSDGSFSVSVSKLLNFGGKHLSPIMESMTICPQNNGTYCEDTVATCEFTLPQTPYKEIRWQKIPQIPEEFTDFTSKSSIVSSSCLVCLSMLLINASFLYLC